MSRKFFYRVIADSIWILHFFVVLIGCFGWLLPSIWLLYICVLIIALISELSLGYCFLSKWEFDLRKKINPNVNYDYGFTSYYTYKFTNHRISNRFYQQVATVFMVVSLLLWIYFRFLF